MLSWRSSVCARFRNLWAIARQRWSNGVSAEAMGCSTSLASPLLKVGFFALFGPLYTPASCSDIRVWNLLTQRSWPHDQYVHKQLACLRLLYSIRHFQ